MKEPFLNFSVAKRPNQKKAFKKKKGGKKSPYEKGKATHSGSAEKSDKGVAWQNKGITTTKVGAGFASGRRSI